MPSAHPGVHLQGRRGRFTALINQSYIQVDISSLKSYSRFVGRSSVPAVQKRSRERLGHLPVQLAIAEGINWAYEPSTYCHYAEQDGVHAMFAGEVRLSPLAIRAPLAAVLLSCPGADCA